MVEGCLKICLVVVRKQEKMKIDECSANFIRAKSIAIFKSRRSMWPSNVFASIREQTQKHQHSCAFALATCCMCHVKLQTSCIMRLYLNGDRKVSEIPTPHRIKR
jgi:hypothetical protein